MRNNRTKKTRLATVALVGAVVLAVLVGTGAMSTMIANTPPDIVPTNTVGITMDVWDGNQPGTLKIAEGIKSGADGKATFIDPTNRFTPVQAMATDTWLSDINAVPISDGYMPSVQESNALPVYDGSHVYTVQVVYHYVIWMTVEIVIRTGPKNVISYVPSTINVSPFDAEAGIYGMLTLQRQPSPIRLYPLYSIYNGETRGALTMWQHSEGNLPAPNEFKTNTMNEKCWGSLGTRRGEIGTHGPYAQITTSLLPYTNWRGMIVPGLSSEMPVADKSRLLAMASARPVLATVTANVAANSELIATYDNNYEYTLASGKKVSVAVDTVSAVVGFSGLPNGLRSTGTYTGIIPNENPLHQVPDFGLEDLSKIIGTSDEQALQDNKVSITGQSPNNCGAPVTLNGHIEPRYTMADQIGNPTHDVGLPTGSMPYTTGGGMGPPAVLDLSAIETNCGLPQVLNITASNTLAPRVTSYNVYADLQYMDAWEDFQDYDWDTRTVNNWMLWSYGLQVDNVMTAQNFTFPVDVVSERAVQLFSSDGSPIDLTTIVDTDMNAIFNDPRLDAIHVTDTTPDISGCHFDILDIPGWFNCLIHKYIVQIIIVLAIFVGVAGLYIFAKIRKAFK